MRLHSLEIACIQYTVIVLLVHTSYIQSLVGRGEGGGMIVEKYIVGTVV